MADADAVCQRRDVGLSKAIAGAHIRTCYSHGAEDRCSTRPRIVRTTTSRCESSDSGEPWFNRPGFVTFVWDCDTLSIIGQST